jgi:hypothetical protein
MLRTFDLGNASIDVVDARRIKPVPPSSSTISEGLESSGESGGIRSLNIMGLTGGVLFDLCNAGGKGNGFFELDGGAADEAEAEPPK